MLGSRGASGTCSLDLEVSLPSGPGRIIPSHYLLVHNILLLPKGISPDRGSLIKRVCDGRGCLGWSCSTTEKTSVCLCHISRQFSHSSIPWVFDSQTQPSVWVCIPQKGQGSAFAPFWGSNLKDDPGGTE